MDKVEKKVDTELLKSAAFNRALQRRCAALYMKLGKLIDTRFNGNAKTFKEALVKMRQYSARANKAHDLNKKEQEAYAKLKTFFRSELEVGALTFCVKVDGKVKRASFKTVSYALLNFGIRVINHGKHLTKNEHWKNFFLPVESKVDEIYAAYKKAVQSQTSIEKEEDRALSVVQDI